MKYFHPRGYLLNISHLALIFYDFSIKNSPTEHTSDIIICYSVDGYNSSSGEFISFGIGDKTDDNEKVIKNPKAKAWVKVRAKALRFSVTDVNGSIENEDTKYDYEMRKKDKNKFKIFHFVVTDFENANMDKEDEKKVDDKTNKKESVKNFFNYWKIEFDNLVSDEEQVDDDVIIEDISDSFEFDRESFLTSTRVEEINPTQDRVSSILSEIVNMEKLYTYFLNDFKRRIAHVKEIASLLLVTPNNEYDSVAILKDAKLITSGKSSHIIGVSTDC